MSETQNFRNGTPHPEIKSQANSHSNSPSDNFDISIRVRGVAEGDNPVEIHANAEALNYPAFHKTVDIVGKLNREGEHLLLEAVAAAEGEFECTRCAEPFRRTIKAPLHVEFVPPRLESDPQDPNIHVYDPLGASHVDIADDVRDALALAIPMKHLCRPDCKGLCPVCGKDRNLEECDHAESHEVAPQWAALKSLSERLRADENKGVAIDKPNPLARN